MASDRERSRIVETAGRLVEELESLKRRGSALLVVGPVVGHDEACTLLLGTAATAPRRRLFVCTGEGERLSTCAGRSPVAVFWYTSTERSTISESGSSAGASPWNAPAVGSPTVGSPTVGSPTDEQRYDSLGSLCRAISDRIDTIESTVDGLEPAELRVCLDSLTAILADDGPEATFRFLHLLTRKIRSVNGMGHVHWPIDPDDPIVSSVSPLFDAVIALRIEDGAVYQRWTLIDSALETAWLPLEHE